MNNFIIGDLILRINVALKGHLKSIKLLNTKLSIEIVELMYKNGLILGYNVAFDYLLVFLKYYKNKSIINKIKLISTPGKKVYWTLDQLSNVHNTLNVYYVISTSKGILMHQDCLLGKNICGKILFIIYV